MKILKFGGSSVKNASNMQRVLDIISARKDKIAVVFSAMGGVTDTLISLGEQAALRDEGYLQTYEQLRIKHLDAAKSLLEENYLSDAKKGIELAYDELKKLLAGVFILGESSPRTMDYILSFGERSSAYIMSQALLQRGRSTEYLDARKLLVTNSNFGNAELARELSHENIRSHFAAKEDMSIITGFIASDSDGKTTTLGRGGGDYTAAIFGEALHAEAIEIWTDVNGILSADPRKVAEAFTIPQVSYQEAMELSHFGAKVIYPPTIRPAMDKKIPVYIKNTMNPTAKGSVIKDKSWSHDKPVIGISAVSDIVLLLLEGPGLFGVPGIAARLFGALALQKINIILITQCSSEHSISFAIRPDDLEQAEKIINDTFLHEIERGLIFPVQCEEELSIVAVIGENMKSTPGISAKLFQSMGVNGINIIAIAQGSSELNISVVIRQSEQHKALNTLHEAFFSDDTRDIHLFIVGVGLIGGTLVDQINNQKEVLREEHGINLNICGIANSKKMFFSNESLDGKSWMSSLKASSEEANISNFVNQMIRENRRNSIFVDNTSSVAVVSEYARILQHSISISTPNKLSASSSLTEYKNLLKIANKRGVQYRYETNVGAGLPVISSLQDLIKSGDKILKIEAVLSGSLSYIFNNFNAQSSFSEIVGKAQELGLTEPDPREDLNGYDVRRKILILAREAGYNLEETDIELDFFLSETARNAESIEAFFEVLSSEDDEMKIFIEGLEAQNKKARMIAQLADGQASVAVQEVGQDSPFYSLEGSDNMIVFTTQRYHERPLVIRGPGAGAEVTAAGVLAEIIRIANSI